MNLKLEPCRRRSDVHSTSNWQTGSVLTGDIRNRKAEPIAKPECVDSTDLAIQRTFFPPGFLFRRPSVINI